MPTARATKKAPVKEKEKKSLKKKKAKGPATGKASIMGFFAKKAV